MVAVLDAGSALLHLPAPEETRSQIAAHLLATYPGEAVVVKGGVDQRETPPVPAVLRWPRLRSRILAERLHSSSSPS